MEDAVVFAVGKLDDLSTQEEIIFNGVSDQAAAIKDELRQAQCTLGHVADDAVIRKLSLEILEAEYDAEDVIEAYDLPRVAGISRLIRCVRDAIVLYKARTELEAIYGRIRVVIASLQRHANKIAVAGERPVSRNDDNPRKSRRRRCTYFDLVEEKEEMVGVGVEDGVRTLVEQLVGVGVEPGCSVVSIWGMGGLGKTALARRVYHHGDVRRHFHHFAWISVSDHHHPKHNHFDARAVLQQLLIQLTSAEQEAERSNIEKMGDEKGLIQRVYEIQKEKKCLVILDDVWRKEDWDRLRPAFAGTGGSKLLLTTRIKAVAEPPVPHFLYQPKLLTEEESWELLKRKALRSTSHDAPAPAPDPMINEEMEQVGKKLAAKHCGGLPLAIVVLGGLLAQRLELPWWQEVDTKLQLNLKAADGLVGVSDALDLSYRDLPYHLKLCFVYMAHFPAGVQEIPVNTLYQMWMAEGITISAADHQPMKEDIGPAACLDELIGRCMVQLVSTNSNGTPKTCCLHGLMRDLGLSKAEECFFQTFNNILQVKINQHEEYHSTNSCKVRRGVIYLDGDNPCTDQTEDYAADPGSLRSLLTFCESPRKLAMDLKKFKLLRVLHLERVVLDRSMVGAIRHLLHLRYLSFKNSRLSCDLSSTDLVGQLGFMETLDLRFDDLVTGLKIHKVLSGVKRVRHLYLPKFIDKSSNTNSSSNKKLQLADQCSWDSLSDLETLKNFDAEHWSVRYLAKLKKLRRLKLMKEVKSFKELEVLLKPSNRLQSLCLDDGVKMKIEEKELMLLSNCQNLYKLKLAGEIIRLPEHHRLPRSLTMIVLRGSRLEQDPMPILERLPNLTALHLLNQAYLGQEMAFSSNGFPQLKHLHLSLLPGLKKLRVEEGAMPCLKGLKIAACHSLEMIPEVVLRDIKTLDSVEFRYMPPEFEKRLQGGDFNNFKHAPSITFFP